MYITLPELIFRSFHQIMLYFEPTLTHYTHFIVKYEPSSSFIQVTDMYLYKITAILVL